MSQSKFLFISPVTASHPSHLCSVAEKTAAASAGGDPALTYSQWWRFTSFFSLITANCDKVKVDYELIVEYRP